MKRILPYLTAALIGLLSASPAPAQDKAPLGLRTICLDPGHGGKDPGCVSRDGKTYEKDIVLAIGLKVREKLRKAHPGMKVLMTREDDTFIELGERAAIANRGNAGLFLSIHVNAVDPKKNKHYASVTGFSIHTLGQSAKGYDLISSNMELCKRENSVIMLEEDYTAKYQGFNPSDPESYIIFNLMQNANLSQSLEFAEDLGARLTGGAVSKNRGISQDPFLVLWKTTMPAVLLEVGFITSAGDLAAITGEAGQEKIAEGIVQAISNFKRRYDKSLNVKVEEPAPTRDSEPEKKAAGETPSPGQPAPKQAEKDTSATAATGSYGTQVLAVGRKLSADDPFFQGWKPVIIPVGSLYKYLLGASSDLKEARENCKKIQKSFPQSFLVEITKDGTKPIR